MYKFVGYMLMNLHPDGTLAEFNGRLYTLKELREEKKSSFNRSMQTAKVYLEV